MVAVGDTAPDFTLKDNHGNDVTLSALRGKPVVIVFYPFTFTGVCEGELCEIRDNPGAFETRVHKCSRSPATPGMRSGCGPSRRATPSRC